jgi:peptidoglycan/xylan/chitin deacetylase (PgdA/CDA1 family)
MNARHPGHVLVLAIHNVVPNGAPSIGDRSLHLPISTFRHLIERLLRSCTAVPLSGIEVAAPDHRPRFAVTFDDAYRGAVTLALPELERLGVPATVFVPTGLVGDRDFWWDSLADPVRGLEDATRHHILTGLAGDDAAAREWAREKGRTVRVMPPLWRSVSLEELRQAALRPGVSLAPHGARHLAFDRLSIDELRRELLDPMAWFDAQGLPFDRTLAYPYGYSSPLVHAEAAGAGYSSAWLVAGGWLETVSGRRLELPRLNVPGGASVRNMFLRIAEFSTP